MIEIIHPKSLTPLFGEWISFLHSFCEWDSGDPSWEEMDEQILREKALLAFYTKAELLDIRESILRGEWYMGCDEDPYAELTLKEISDPSPEEDDAAVQTALNRAHEKGCRAGRNDALAPARNTYPICGRFQWSNASHLQIMPMVS